MKITHLYPASYSQKKTVNAVINCILQYPEQDVNTPPAYEYSVEFITSPGSPVGTLSEYHKTEPSEKYHIHLVDGEIVVHEKEGKFYFSSLKLHPDPDATKYLHLLEGAFVDIMDGTEEGDIQMITGLTMDRVKEIMAVFQVVLEKTK